MLLHLCRGCKGQTSLILDLGRTAPSRRFLTPEMTLRPEPNAPLRLARCQTCGLLQLDEACPGEPDEWSAGPPADAEANARQLVERHGLQSSDLVLEIGDGAYAARFRPFGVRTRAIVSPEQIERRDFGTAKVVLARNALCGTDLEPFLNLVRDLLYHDGVAIFELSHALPIVERLEYDAIRHETPCYFSVEGLCLLAARTGLEVIDAVPLPEEPGIIRVTLQREGGPLFARPAIEAMIAREQTVGVNRLEAWADFAQLVQQSRDLLTSEIEDWHYRGKRVVAYSRDGRGMTLLAYCGIDSRQIPFVVDQNPELHGRLTPGHRIRIVGPEQLRRDRADVILWLAGNWKPELSAPLAEYCRRDARNLLPLPKPHYAGLVPTAHQRMADQRLADTIVPGLSFSDFA